MQANNFTPIVTFALLLAVSLAGCLGDGSSDAAGADDSGAGGADGGNQTADDGNGTVPQDGGDGAQSPPLAKIHVSGENVTANGSSYVFAENVTVTFDASNSTDPAGGNLAFTWDFGDDVTAEGAVVAMNFTEGNHTVDMTATSDASGQSSSARATLQVEAAEGADGAAVGAELFTADVAVFCELCWTVGKDASVSYQTGEDGIDSAWIEFGPGFDGLPFTATAAGDADIFFHAGCDGEELELFDNDGNEAGVVPEGATCGWVYDYTDSGTIELVIG